MFVGLQKESLYNVNNTIFESIQISLDPELLKVNGQAPSEAIESFPDLNGENLTPFQRSLDVADQAHKSSLSLVPGPPSNSPFQDRPDSNATSTPAGYKDSGGPADGLY